MGDFMKSIALGIIALGSISAFAENVTCPERSRIVYDCKANSKTATSRELKESVKDMFVCYSSLNKKHTLVIQNKNGDSEFLSARNYNEEEISIFEVESDMNLVPVLEINTEIEQANSIYTDFMKGGEIKLTCKKVK